MAISDGGDTPAADGRTLSIGALSRATRIPVETLRTWERRYGAPLPVRKPSGHRVYPAAAVEHLRRVGRLLAHGHRPGDVLGLSRGDLDAMLSLYEPARTAPGRAPGAEPPGAEFVPGTIEALLQATAEFDRGRLMAELGSAWARLGPLRFLEEIAGAFMVELGRAWHGKRLEVRHEHFASACLSDFLRSVREPYDRQARGPRIVAALLPDEQHEGGLLMASVLMAVRGSRVLYLGANTPIEQIAAAARGGGAEVVAVSVSAAMPRARAARSLASLRKALPARVALWVGGAGEPSAGQGIERFESLADLDARLA